jgi:hypothetical protein
MKFQQFFEYFVTVENLPDESGEVKVCSPFRNETRPSLSLNLEDGRFKDFGDDDIAGDPIKWLMLFLDIDFSKASLLLQKYLRTGELSLVPIDIAEVNYCQRMLKSKSYLNKRFITKSVIDEYRIGWNVHINRYIIPIFTQRGICVNLRMYSPENGDEKMISYSKGYGLARLYPFKNYDISKPTILCEGEWDALCLRGFGYNSLTNTNGASTWLKSWNSQISDIVYICYDNDEAGRKGTAKTAEKLFLSGKQVYIIALPIKDITDYFKAGYSKENFDTLIENAKLYEPAKEVQKSTSKIHLIEATSNLYRNKKLHFDARVVGKDTSPYNIPLEVEFRCCNLTKEERRCASCALQKEEVIPLKFAVGPKLLDLFKISKSAQKNLLRNYANVSGKCPFVSLEVIKSLNIEELLIAPDICETNMFHQYKLQQAFFAGDKIVESNRSYSFKGTMTPDPWNQKVTFMLDEVSPLQDDISLFKLTAKMKEDLKIFQVHDTIKNKVREIHQDFEKLTNIIGREDLLTGIDFTYHSVLNFDFQGYPVQKGWMDILVVGDTRTGKTETIEKMLKHFQLGEMSTAENTSFAGLVGGLQQMNDKKWFITWGKIPLNDGRIFVIDEVSGLSAEDISKMSGIRSSGIAEITKIHTERTFARTRLLWLSNPREGRPMNTYSHGCEVLPSLIGKVEDIARFDFCIATSKDDVSIQQINETRRKSNKKLKYTSELCKNLILWSWSRKAENINFTEEAEKLILEYAILQGRKYSNRIPLVEGANQRIKIAKMAVAIACRVFSTEDGENVVVDVEHVKFAYDFLEAIYSKNSFDYSGYSRKETDGKQKALEMEAELIKAIKMSQLTEILRSSRTYTLKALEEQSPAEDNMVRMSFKKLVAGKMFEKGASDKYYPSANLIKLLKKMERMSEDEKETVV